MNHWYNSRHLNHTTPSPDMQEIRCRFNQRRSHTSVWFVFSEILAAALSLSLSLSLSLLGSSLSFPDIDLVLRRNDVSLCEWLVLLRLGGCNNKEISIGIFVNTVSVMLCTDGSICFLPLLTSVLILNSNSSSKTLFYKDCSLGSVKNLFNN